MKKVIFFALIIISISCREGYTYLSLTPDEKSAFLFYSLKGDKFEYLINNTDTISYTITEKNIGFSGKYYSYTQKQYCFVSLLNNNNCKYNMYINYVANNSDDFSEPIYGDLDSCYMCCSNNFGVFTNNINISKISKKNLTVSFNNNTFYNVFLLVDEKNYSQAYTNKKYGILKIWNDTLCYEILKKES